MMENYQETIGNSRPNQLEVALDSFGLVNDSQERYDFGAEIKAIITPKQIVGDGAKNENGEIKTNVESITSTKTEQIFLTCATANRVSAADVEANEEEDLDAEDNPQQSQADVSDESDDDSSTDSDFSDVSGLSDVSGKEWKPVTRKPMRWVQKQINLGRNPRELLTQVLPHGSHSIPLGHLTDMTLWRLITSVLCEPPRRQKLRHVNTFEDVIHLISKSENIIVLTGAGVSVSCGIPDFRSSDGIYSRLAKDYPNLPDPQAMFDIDYFSRDPRPFYKFAREIYPGQFKPSPCHRFIKLLEDKQRLLRNYTQNIDTLEQVAGIQRVIECHGSFSTASCTKCKFKCDADAIRAEIFAQRIPVCPRCQPHVHQSVDAAEPVSEYDLRLLVANGIMKPDIVFFGEGLPDEFHKVMASDKDKCDLLIVIGSSLKVRPVALIPCSLPGNVPQILINREQLNHLEFDVELLGDSDIIINQICHRLGENWKEICFDERVLVESKELKPFEEVSEDDEEDNDDTTPQLQDTDTQSVKSNGSMDVAYRSVGACSDSGFESSTSMGQTEITGKIHGNDGADSDIGSKKTSILDFNGPLANGAANSDFHPFTARPGQEAAQMTPPAIYAANLRHLSIDSTKDSGIMGDSSNSATTTTPVTTEGEENASTQPNDTAASDSTITTVEPPNTHIKTQASTSSQFGSNPNRRRKSRSCSAAEFLVDGSYYYHKNSCSYVFPGAQISWYADSDSEMDEDNDDDEGDDNNEMQCQTDNDDANNTCNASDNDQDSDDDDDHSAHFTTQRSNNIYGGLMSVPPSMGTQMVSDIETIEATTSTCTASATKMATMSRISTCAKRRSSVCETAVKIEITKTCEIAANSDGSFCDETPPQKRRRNSNEPIPSAKTILTTNISSSDNTSTQSGSNDLPKIESVAAAVSDVSPMTATTATAKTEALQEI